MLTWLAKLPKPIVWIVVGLAVALVCVFGLWRYASRIIRETKAALELAAAERDAARRSAERERKVDDEHARVEADTRTEREKVEEKLGADLAEIAARPKPPSTPGRDRRAALAREMNRRREEAAKRAGGSK